MLYNHLAASFQDSVGISETPKFAFPMTLLLVMFFKANSELLLDRELLMLCRSYWSIVIVILKSKSDHFYNCYIPEFLSIDSLFLIMYFIAFLMFIIIFYWMLVIACIKHKVALLIFRGYVPRPLVDSWNLR